MSLINDAIKKANKANKQKASRAPGSGGIPPNDGMRSARPSAPHSSGGMTGMLIVAGVVIFVLLGGFLLVLGFQNRAPVPAQTVEDIQPVVIPDEPASEAGSATTASIDPPDSTPEPVVVHSSIDEVMSEANPLLEEAPTPPAIDPEPVTPPKPAGPPEFPALKLQGIFYRLNDPSVILNSKTLWIDEVVDGVKVIKIERSTVTVEFDGRTKVLELK